MLITKNMPIKEILKKLYNNNIKYAYVCDMVWAVWDLLELDGFEDLIGLMIPNTKSSYNYNLVRIMELNCSQLKVEYTIMKSLSDNKNQVCGFSIKYENRMVGFFEFKQSCFSYTEQKKEIIKNIIDYYCKYYIEYFRNILY